MSYRAGRRWWWLALVAACGTGGVARSRAGTTSASAQSGLDDATAAVVAVDDGGALAPSVKSDAAVVEADADWDAAQAADTALANHDAAVVDAAVVDAASPDTLPKQALDAGADAAASGIDAANPTDAGEVASVDATGDQMAADAFADEVDADAVLPTPPGPCAAVVIGSACVTVDPTGALPGACAGQWQCASDGPHCSASPPSPELCNGLDDDCDGATDVGAPCSDGDDCTVGDHCAAGACTPGASICQCKQASDCPPVASLCEGPVQCVNHVCVAGPAVVCPEVAMGPCLKSVCLEATGKCATLPQADGGACDADSNPCTANDQCQNGSCMAGSPVVCDDGNPCTSDACLGGKCIATPNALACSDGNACTVGDMCQGGACLPGAATSCNDGNVCTADSCDPLNGKCGHSLLPACLAQTWQRAIGGAKEENFYGVVSTGDGGYVAAGSTKSWGAGGMDGWVVKVDGCGEVVWSRTFGGAKDEEFWSIAATPDGGFVVGGSSTTWPGSFIVKLDSLGNAQWQRVYGGGGYDYARLTRSLADGGILALVEQYTFSSKPNIMHKATVMKLNPSGDVVWIHTYGGQAEGDTVNGVVEQPDGKLVLGGGEESDGFSVGSDDFWLLTLDANGKHLSSRLYGTEADEEPIDFIQTSDGGWLFAGKVDGGTIYHANDAALVKVAPDGKLQWARRWGGFDDDRAQKVFETSEGFAVMGRTASFGASKDTGSKWSPSPGEKYNPNVQVDMFFARFDKAGTLLSMTTYGNAESQYGFRAAPDGQGGFVLAGLAFGFGNGSADGFLVHVDALGNTGGCDSSSLPLAQVDQAAYKMGSKTFVPSDFGGGGLLKSASASAVVWPVSASVCACQ